MILNLKFIIYRRCYGDGGASNIDNFGDKYDPNDPEGLWKKCSDQMMK